MLIDWPKFIAALFLLLTPIGVFHGKKVRYRPISSDWAEYWTQILTFGLHAIDLARAATGMWLLADALHPEPGVRGLLRYAVISSHACVAVAAVTLQTAVCKEEDSSNAPFAFLIGLVLGYLPPVIAGFAILITLVITAGSRSPAAFFPLLAVSSAGMGLLFTGKRHLFILVVTACAALVPWMISLLFSRDLVVTYRARRRSSSDVSVSHPPLR